jgi:hypothetical protein
MRCTSREAVGGERGGMQHFSLEKACSARTIGRHHASDNALRDITVIPLYDDGSLLYVAL